MSGRPQLQPHGSISIFSAINWFATSPEHDSFVSEEESNLVDGHDVPVPHFGAVLEIPNFESLSRKLEAAGVRFVVEPHVRFKGQSWRTSDHVPAGSERQCDRIQSLPEHPRTALRQMSGSTYGLRLTRSHATAGTERKSFFFRLT